MRTYICPYCSDEKTFGGLCRDCTEYNEAGEVLKPIRRVKNTGHVHIHDENCNHDHDHEEGIQISNNPFFTRTVQDFVNARRPKPSKKQIQTMNKLLEEAQEIGGEEE